MCNIPCTAAFRQSNNYHPNKTGALSMMVNVMLQPLVALIAGVLILLVPRLLNYIVALYLIIVGIVGLLPQFAH
jgi:hypothetical protein